MTKRIVMVAVAIALAFTCKVGAEEAVKAAKKAAPAKQPKVVETRIHESDMNKIELAISKAVSAKQGTGSWEYMAKKMKPPKNDKWVGKWNEVGAEGWDAVDHFENVYIFKRPAVVGTYKKAEPVAAESAKDVKKEDKAKEKALKDADKEKEKAQKDAEKAAKKVEKEKDKAAKKAEKEAKKAVKEKEKAAKKSE